MILGAEISIEQAVRQLGDVTQTLSLAINQVQQAFQLIAKI